MIPTPVPTIAVVIDGYTVQWESLGVLAVVTRLEERRGDLTCELSIGSTRQPAGALLASTRFNLMGANARSDLTRKLTKRDSDMDWDAMLEQLVIGILALFRAGEPTIDMRFYMSDGKPLWHIWPLMERGGPTVLFGDGGQGKTTVAIAIAVSIASGAPIVGRPHAETAPVMFLDYEGQPEQFSTRIAALCAGSAIPVPPVHYRREYVSLPEAASGLRREIEKVGAKTVIIDNIGTASGGAPEAADVTLAFFRAVDALHVPALLIDHVTKNGGADQTKAYGSVYKHNRPRLAWRLMSRREAKDGDSFLAIALTEHKHNNVGYIAPLNYRLRFQVDDEGWPTTIQVGSGDVLDVPAAVSVWDIIYETLRQQPLKREDLAAHIGRTRSDIDGRVATLIARGSIQDKDGVLYLTAKAN